MSGTRPVVVSYPRRRPISEADLIRCARVLVAAQRASERDTERTEEQ